LITQQTGLVPTTLVPTTLVPTTLVPTTLVPTTLVPYEKMSLTKVETLAYHLSLQLQLLESKGYTLLYWQPTDISVFDNQIYILSNLSHMVPLSKTDQNYLSLKYPIDLKPLLDIIAPEFFDMKSLPFITERSASYYSLGLLCQRLLDGSISYGLDDLRGSKLFYFLERCLNPDPSLRSCFFLS
jgi:hypothetical protein